MIIVLPSELFTVRRCGMIPVGEDKVPVTTEVKDMNPEALVRSVQYEFSIYYHRENMALLSFIFTPWTLSVVFSAWLIVYYILPYFTTYRHLSGVPGPLIAKFSNIWVGLSARRGQKFAAVDSAHRKYGKIVRIGFNHVSIADERALKIVSRHGHGFLEEYGPLPGDLYVFPPLNENNSH